MSRRPPEVMSTSKNASVLLIGASRGLGYAIATEYVDRGAKVVATVRGQDRTALHDLQETADGLLDIEHVDITVPEQVQALRQRLGSRTFDLLFVNAGVGVAETVADVDSDEFVRVMVTNALSPMRVIETFADVVPSDGTIAIMSSGQGSIANNNSGGARDLPSQQIGPQSTDAQLCRPPPRRPAVASPHGSRLGQD